jgi:hypothetical protein
MIIIDEKIPVRNVLRATHELPEDGNKLPNHVEAQG